MGRPFPDLQMEESPRLERAERIVQRVAWPLLYLLLVAVAFGLLGRGPLAEVRHRVDGEDPGLDYRRFATARSDTEMEITLQPRGDVARLQIGGEYFRSVRIESVQPPASRTMLDADSAIYEFAAMGSTPVVVRLFVKTREAGRYAGWIGTGDGPRRFLRQWVLP